MPFEFGIPIDPGFKKILQSRVRTLLQAKTEGYVFFVALKTRCSMQDQSGSFAAISIQLCLSILRKESGHGIMEQRQERQRRIGVHSARRAWWMGG